MADYGDVPLHIVCVVENFHFDSLRNEIESLILALYPPEVDNVLIRIRPENRAEILTRIRKIWEKTIPGYPFHYSFPDEDFNQSLTSMKRTGYLLTAKVARANPVVALRYE